MFFLDGIYTESDIGFISMNIMDTTDSFVMIKFSNQNCFT